jgi:hypothetical protein
MRIIAILVLAAVLAGCANFKAVSAFANETTGLAGTVRTEFDQLQALCFEQAERSLAVLDIEADAPTSPLKGCESYRDTQGRLAEVTVATLDVYARTLLALAENRTFDLGPDIESTSGKLAALRQRDGSALVDEAQLGALTKVLVLLADIATQTQRERAIRRLVAERPNVVANAQLLRSFFARPASASGALRAPYENLVTLSADTLRSYETLLRNAKLREAEPIRTRELLLGLRPTRELLLERQGLEPTSVPGKIVAAIDAWIAAAEVFEREALQPEPLALYGRLQDLRTKAVAARDAVRATASR